MLVKLIKVISNRTIFIFKLKIIAFKIIDVLRQYLSPGKKENTCISWNNLLLECDHWFAKNGVVR